MKKIRILNDYYYVDEIEYVNKRRWFKELTRVIFVFSNKKEIECNAVCAEDALFSIARKKQFVSFKNLLINVNLIKDFQKDKNNSIIDIINFKSGNQLRIQGLDISKIKTKFNKLNDLATRENV